MLDASSDSFAVAGNDSMSNGTSHNSQLGSSVGKKYHYIILCI